MEVKRTWLVVQYSMNLQTKYIVLSVAHPEDVVIF